MKMAETSITLESHSLKTNQKLAKEARNINMEKIGLDFYLDTG